jgi:hypothetical protein
MPHLGRFSCLKFLPSIEAEYPFSPETAYLALI